MTNGLETVAVNEKLNNAGAHDSVCQKSRRWLNIQLNKTLHVSQQLKKIWLIITPANPTETCQCRKTTECVIIVMERAGAKH